MGLYSVCPGTDQYVLGSPLFPKMTIHLENGKDLVIQANGNDLTHCYINSAKFNGKRFTRNWLSFGELIQGGLVEYEMSDQPSLQRTSLIPSRKIINSKLLRCACRQRSPCERWVQDYIILATSQFYLHSIFRWRSLGDFFKLSNKMSDTVVP